MFLDVSTFTLGFRTREAVWFADCKHSERGAAGCTVAPLARQDTALAQPRGPAFLGCLLCFVLFSASPERASVVLVGQWGEALT